MWIELTVEAVKRRLTGVEFDSACEIALAQGQEDPLPEIIKSCLVEIRGRLAAKHTLAEGDTIPEELESSALAVIRYRMITRLPDVGMLTEDRRTEYRDAQSLIKDAASGAFAFEAPVHESSQQRQGTNSASALVGKTRRRATRDSLKGL